jgi:hypothetical protein
MMEELKQLVTEQRALIDGQAQRIGALEQDLTSIKRQQAGGVDSAARTHAAAGRPNCAAAAGDAEAGGGGWRISRDLPPGEARTQSMIRQRVRCGRCPFVGLRGLRAEMAADVRLRLHLRHRQRCRPRHQAGHALKRTQRTSINMTWSPVPQADIALAFLLGTRVNKDNEQGTSSQIQLGWIYRF